MEAADAATIAATIGRWEKLPELRTGGVVSPWQALSNHLYDLAELNVDPESSLRRAQPRLARKQVVLREIAMGGSEEV